MKRAAILLAVVGSRSCRAPTQPSSPKRRRRIQAAQRAVRHRCVVPNAVRVTIDSLPPGTYDVMISDDVNVNYYASIGLRSCAR